MSVLSELFLHFIGLKLPLERVICHIVNFDEGSSFISLFYLIFRGGGTGCMPLLVGGSCTEHLCVDMI